MTKYLGFCLCPSLESDRRETDGGGGFEADAHEGWGKGWFVVGWVRSATMPRTRTESKESLAKCNQIFLYSTGIEVFMMSNVLCLICFEIYITEGRGGRREGRQILKQSSQNL